jgi:hypothetical protein
MACRGTVLPLLYWLRIISSTFCRRLWLAFFRCRKTPTRSDVAVVSHVHFVLLRRRKELLHFGLYINFTYHHSFSFRSQLEHRASFGVSVITHILRHTAGLLWTRWARRRGLYLHRTPYNTRDKHPCPERYSNPRPQQPSGRRPTP